MSKVIRKINKTNCMQMLTMAIKINWEPFWENTSSREELCRFADGRSSLREFGSHLWTNNCTAEFKKLKRLPVKVARRKAMAAARRHGCY